MPVLTQNFITWTTHDVDLTLVAEEGKYLICKWFLCAQILVLASSGDEYSYKHELLRVTERNFSPSGTEVTYQGLD